MHITLDKLPAHIASQAEKIGQAPARTVLVEFKLFVPSKKYWTYYQFLLSKNEKGILALWRRCTTHASLTKNETLWRDAAEGGTDWRSGIAACVLDRAGKMAGRAGILRSRIMADWLTTKIVAPKRIVRSKDDKAFYLVGFPKSRKTETA